MFDSLCSMVEFLASTQKDPRVQIHFDAPDIAVGLFSLYAAVQPPRLQEPQVDCRLSQMPINLLGNP